MKKKPVQEVHYKELVWVNPTTESLRKEECLCLNCGGMPDCGHAKALYKICVSGELALAVTRCKGFAEKS